MNFCGEEIFCLQKDSFLDSVLLVCHKKLNRRYWERMKADCGPVLNTAIHLGDCEKEMT